MDHLQNVGFSVCSIRINTLAIQLTSSKIRYIPNNPFVVSKVPEYKRLEDIGLELDVSMTSKDDIMAIVQNHKISYCFLGVSF